MQINFTPINIDYVNDKQGNTWIRVFGKTDQGRHCCIFDTCDAFFYLFPEAKSKEDIKKYAKKVGKVQVETANRIASVIKTEVVNKNFIGQPVKAVKVYVKNHKDINPIKDIVRDWPETLDKQETDIPFTTRYILEKKLKPLQWHFIEGEETNNKKLKEQGLKAVDVDTIIKTSDIKPIQLQTEFKPKALAFDIECNEFEIGAGNILMVSIAGEKLKKVITWKKFSNAPKEIEFVKDEKQLLLRFKEIIKKEKPDCLVGYFSDGFDLPYLKARFEHHKIKSDLGLDNSNIEASRGFLRSAKIPGITHLDLFKFVSGVISANLNTETLSLNDVASELLGEKKVKLEQGIAKSAQKIDELNNQELKRFCFYNLQDSILTYKLFQKLWLMLLELTKVIQEPLFNVSRYSYTNLVENYMIHNIGRFNEIVPNRPSRTKINKRRARAKSPGAFVLQPQYGFYDNIVVFDFTGMYTTILVTYNVCPSTIKEVEVKADSKSKSNYDVEVELDNKKRYFYFDKKKKGIFPSLIEDVFYKRKTLKKQLKEKKDPVLSARSYVFKVLGSAIHGYYRFFGSRWHNQECAAAILALAKKSILETIEKTKKQGYNVIYSDTDSILFEQSTKTKKQILELLKQLNSELPGIMELELEDFYTRGIFVAKRTVKLGAKKKYALLSVNHEFKIRGFETVRRDWCKLAKKMQSKVLRQILEEGKPDNALKYVKEIIYNIKNKKIPNEEMIILTQLKKEIEDYKSIGPHVIIAKRMKERGIPVRIGALIEFIIAETRGNSKKKLVRDRVKIPDEVPDKGYDSDYYIEKQIVPAVENIFDVFNIPKEKLLGKGQKKLGEF